MAQTSTVPHYPLDPLTAAEIRLAVTSLRAAGKVRPQTRFGVIALAEPNKIEVRRQVASGMLRRLANVVLYDWATDTPAEATVDLTNGALASWHELPVRRPPFGRLVAARLEEALRQDPRWREALKRRGVLDPTFTHPEPHVREGDTLRLTTAGRVVSLDGISTGEAPPRQYLQDLDVEVNLTTAQVIRFVDSAATRPQRPSAGRSHTRPMSLPTSVPNITTRAGEVRWHAWRLRLGVDPRRGLELFDVAWEDSMRRLVLYRASVSETMATYGDPVFASFYPFDEGAYGLGHGTSPMVIGQDAPRDAHFMDAVIADARGIPRRVPRAVAMYERSGDVAWRHAGTACGGRQLVIASHATIGNYDYVFNWVFSRAGTIEVEVLLTGAMNLMPQPSTRDSLGPGLTTAWEVEDHQRAPIHQHFFSYRLDFDMASDARDQVIEQDAEPAPTDSLANPGGEWFAVREHRLLSELGARRQTNPASSRLWRVVAAADTDGAGSPGYALVPDDNTVALQTAEARPRRKAGFLKSQLWVTVYAPEEMHAAGDYPYWDQYDDGLPRWTQADRKVTNADLVLWYTLGITHTPRPEDYPIMPTRRVSFRLMPSGFFRRNPVYEADVACR